MKDLSAVVYAEEIGHCRACRRAAVLLGLESGARRVTCGFEPCHDEVANKLHVCTKVHLSVKRREPKSAACLLLASLLHSFLLHCLLYARYLATH
jgi:hypothetical protein